MLDKMFTAKCMQPRPDWNRCGPHVSTWFKRRLKRFDKSLVLQYIPPNTHPASDHNCMNAEQYPQGGWQICRRMKNGWLHKLAVFSLTDRYGRFCHPNPETFKILAYCRKQWRDQKFEQMQDMMENSMKAMKRAAMSQTREDLMQSMQDFQTCMGNKQHHNRVFCARTLEDNQ